MVSYQVMVTRKENTPSDLHGSLNTGQCVCLCTYRTSVLTLRFCCCRVACP